jgi:hypothetical protein
MIHTALSPLETGCKERLAEESVAQVSVSYDAGFEG